MPQRQPSTHATIPINSKYYVSRKEAFHSQGSMAVAVDTASSITPEARFGIVADFVVFIARLLQELGCCSVHVSSGFI